MSHELVFTSGRYRQHVSLASPVSPSLIQAQFGQRVKASFFILVEH